MKLAAARPGVIPTNHAARVSSVVPVLPATGRPTVPNTPGAVDQSPHGPVAARYPVTQRAASTAARAASTRMTWRHFGAAWAVSDRPVMSVIDTTGSGVQ